MSPETQTLSRRAILAGAAAVPALALPGGAVAAVSPDPVIALDPPALPAEPTKIARLWAEHEAGRARYNVAYRYHRKLEREAVRRAGPPNPAIIMSEETKALGVEHHLISERRGYLQPIEFEIAIRRKLSKTVDDQTGRLLPPTKEKRAEARPLKNLLKISRRHDDKVHRLLCEAGGDAANDKMDELCSEYSDYAWRVLDMPSASPDDIKIKLAINKRYGDNCGAESIMRDVRNLMKHPAFAKVFPAGVRS
jgi:hypothetical protein